MANQKLPDLFGDQVEIKSLDINLLGNNVLFTAPKLSIDSTQNDAHVNIQTQAKEIRIEGFSLWDLLASSELGVDKLTIDSVSIHLELPEDTTYQNSRKQIHLFITEIFTSIRVKKLILENVNIQVTKRAGQDTLLTVNGIYLTSNEVVVDTATVNNIFPLESEHSSVRIDSFKATFDKAYAFSGKDFLMADTTVTMTKLRLKSVYSKSAFTLHHTYEKARLDLEVAQLTLRGLLWDFDHDRFNFYASWTAIDTAKFLVYKDKRPPEQPNKVKHLLSQVIQEIPFTITVDSIEVRKSYIEYEQFPVTFPNTGKVFFDNLYVSAFNLTNDTGRLQKEPQMSIHVQTDFMSRGELKTNIYLDLSSPKQEFKVDGTLGELPMTYVNEAMTPLVGVTADGLVHGLGFEFSGDNNDASGSAQFEYSNLKIAMHDEHKNKELVKSLFRNFLLRNNNRKEDGLTYKEGEIYFIRYQNKDFFNYLWNSLRVGLMDIVIPFYTNPDLETPPSGPKFKEDS